MERVDLCQICKKPEFPDHDASAPGPTVSHVFTPVGSPVDMSQFDRKRPKATPQGNTPGSAPEMRMTTLSGPIDPVLRQALITKGIITPDDLIEAERMIQVLTRQVTSQE